MWYWTGVDRFKLRDYFRRNSKVKAFLLKEIKAVVLQECRDDLIAMKTRHGLEVNDYDRSVVICNIIARW